MILYANCSLEVKWFNTSKSKYCENQKLIVIKNRLTQVLYTYTLANALPLTLHCTSE